MKSCCGGAGRSGPRRIVQGTQASSLAQARAISAHGSYDLTGNLFLVLAEQPGLKRENIVEHAFDPPALEPVVWDEPACAEDVTKLVGEWPVNPGLPLGESILQDLKALVEGSHARPLGSRAQTGHVPRTSSRPPTNTRT